ncbi:hypothetical protein [Alicyclobacillus ferrooxydans]|uniref:Uncharacterized protein n=1 Tax=Alicyclobacillus ferrooxydans TaxID=471514 RepID=A0A0P9CTB6_9BACL|nr:hypothetical protein [Alicyclobacillus ferrooxydans]KPV39902.1 hypothetical protein AN477_22055 [Alicyclobacillus ferrooxydans]
MKYVPSTVVLAVLLLIFASWPSIETWSDLTPIHHFWVHSLYLLSGGLFGAQTSHWVTNQANLPTHEERGVSS